MVNGSKTQQETEAVFVGLNNKITSDQITDEEG